MARLPQPRMRVAAVIGAAATRVRRRVGRPPVLESAEFEPVLPAQWPIGDREHSVQAEKRLMLAVLADAIDIVVRDTQTTNPRRALAHRQALDWIHSDDRGWPFSFANVCEALDLHPDAVREGVVRLAIAHPSVVA